MRHLLVIIVLLAITSRVKPAFDDGGLSTMVTVPYDSPTACLVSIGFELQSTQIKFTSTIIKNDFYDCTRHNLQFISTFRGDQLDANVTLSPTADPKVWSGYLTLADIAKMNGTSCLYSGFLVDNKHYYGCIFRYANIYFVFDFGLNPVTGQIATDWVNLINPLLGITKKNAQVLSNGSSIDVWRPNTTYPHLVGMLYNQCGSWSSVISGSGTPFTVTGTELQSNTLNLQTWLGSYYFDNLWIRKEGDPTHYYVIPRDLNTKWYPFSSTPVNNCTNTGKTYGAFVTDPNFCKQGCDAAMFLLNGTSVFWLELAGFSMA